MIEHLDEGTLQALLDGELEEGEVSARAHLSECVACRAEYESLRGASVSVAGAFSLLDRSPPVRVLRIAPPSTAIRRPHRFVAALPRAAVLVLGFAVAGSATIPGSPVRTWIESRFEAPGTDSEAIAVASEVAPAAAERGVGTAPLDGRLRIVVTDARPGLPVLVQLTSAPVGGAFSVGAPETTRFRSANGVIEVLQAGGEELRVEIPASAVEAALEVNGRTVVVKDGERLLLIEGTDQAAAENEVSFLIGG